MKILHAERLHQHARTFLLALLAAFLPVGCGSKPEVATHERAPRSVTVSTVSPQSVPIVMEINGALKSVTEAKIRARVTGYMMEQNFTAGQFVKEGTPLYLIDPRPFRAQLDSALAQLASDKANLIYQQAEERRYTAMAAAGSASQERLESAVAQRGEAEASIEGDLAAIEQAELNLEFTRVTAPFSGVVQISKPDIGDLIRENEDILTTLVQVDPMNVMFNLSRRQLFGIQDLQQRGKVPSEIAGNLQVEIQMPDGKPYAHRGTVNFVGSEIDPTTDSLVVRAKVPNPHNEHGGVALIAGQYVPVKLYVGTDPDALLIPQKSMMQTQQGTIVYVVGAGEKVETRVIEVGATHDDSIVVSKGLHKGERVIVDGIQMVRDGEVVKATSAVSPKPTDKKKDS
ncbi:MAG: efflux RND transporter periplasmic adaptor subunit [Planctomycetota bacterium]|nr:efflux RND transporter periplasmic adaptor subunit [Planctomycetota bacterium]